MNFRGIIESLKNNFKKNTSTYLSVLGGLFIFIIIALVIPRGDNDIEKKETKKFKEPEYLYGICIDSLDIEIDTIKKNQFLSNIMLKKNINYNVITHIEKNHRKTFDIRKIKPGQRHLVSSPTLLVHFVTSHPAPATRVHPSFGSRVTLITIQLNINGNRKGTDLGSYPKG